MHKDFDQWNELKKKIDAETIKVMPFPQTGEVWICAIGRNIGYEQNGSGDSFSRPVLVVKKFNNQMFWVVALSSKQKKFDFYYNFTDPYRQKAALILAQLKLISIKRLKRMMYILPSSDFKRIKKKLQDFLT